MVFLQNNRRFWLVMFLGSMFLMGSALYFQEVMNLKPCFLCIVQRMAVLSIGIGSFIVLLNPKKMLARISGSLIVFLASLVGLGAALRQMYMQRFPDPMASCGPGYEYILENSSLVEALPKLFSATGSCSEIDWSFLGLSMAEWMIPVFLGFIALNLIVNLKRAI